MTDTETQSARFWHLVGVSDAVTQILLLKLLLVTLVDHFQGIFQMLNDIKDF